jgi:hypothetical protein
MSNTIFFRVGTADRISLSAFVDSLYKFLGILRDLDSALSENKRGSMEWEVTSLRKESPAIVGVTPTLKRLNTRDFGEAVEAQFINNTRSLNSKGERNEYMPDSALMKLKAIAARTKRLGPMSVFVGKNGDEAEELVNIDQATLKRVKELTDVKFTGYGSIKGNLDSISVHLKDEFRVWDSLSGRPVRCSFARSMDPQVRDYLRQAVVVSGILQSNSAGLPIAMDVQGLDLASVTDAPTIEGISGLVDDFTDGKPLKEFIEEISDE